MNTDLDCLREECSDAAISPLWLCLERRTVQRIKGVIAALRSQ